MLLICDGVSVTKYDLYTCKKRKKKSWKSVNPKLQTHSFYLFIFCSNSQQISKMPFKTNSAKQATQESKSNINIDVSNLSSQQAIVVFQHFIHRIYFRYLYTMAVSKKSMLILIAVLLIGTNLIEITNATRSIKIGFVDGVGDVHSSRCPGVFRRQGLNPLQRSFNTIDRCRPGMHIKGCFKFLRKCILA